MLHIVNNIKLIKHVAGINNYQLGEIIGATEAMIKAYTGKKQTPVPSIIAQNISEFAGITMDQLYRSQLHQNDLKIKVEKVEKVKVVEEEVSTNQPSIVTEPDYKDKYIKLLEKREAENEANLNLVLATVAGNQKILGALYDLVEDSKKDKSVIAIYRKDTEIGK